MKTHLVCFILLFCSFHANSQTGKGSVMLGGYVGYNSSSRKTTNIASGNPINSATYRSILFNPGIGYFLRDNFVVGLAIHLGQNKAVSDFNPQPTFHQTYVQHTEGLDLFATKYFMMNTNFGFYVGMNAGAAQSNSKQTTTDLVGGSTSSEYKGSSMHVSANAGIVYFPSRHIGLQAGIGNLGWSQNKSDDTVNKESTSGFNAGINAVTLQIGLYYFFVK